MFRRILLAVDGSDASIGAARVAGRIAAECNAELRIVTVEEPPSEVLGEPNYTNRLEQVTREGADALNAAVAAAREAGSPAPSVERLVTGHTPDIIVQAAHSGGHDLIVLGNRGRGRLRAAVLGSVSTAVATKARIPVLVVPHLAS